MPPQLLPASWLTRAVVAARRRVGFAGQYRSPVSWVASFYDALVRDLPGHALPGRGTELEVMLRQLPCPVGIRLGTTDWYILEEVFLRRVYEPARDAAPPRVATVLDLGANVGMTTLLWNAWWPSARIVAVEPDPENLDQLRRNAARAGLGGRLSIVRACATGSARTVYLDRSGGEAAYHLAESGAAEDSVPGRTVYDILRETACERVDLLKCDIEGAEREVFAQCSSWIDRVASLVVEVHDDYRPEHLLAAVNAQGGRFRRVPCTDPQVVILTSRAEEPTGRPPSAR